MDYFMIYFWVLILTLNVFFAAQGHVLNAFAAGFAVIMIIENVREGKDRERKG